MSLLIVKGVAAERENGVVLSGISFSQNRFQKIALAGETGSGKSTLLKIIAGLEQPTQGEVFFNNEKVLGPQDTLVPGHSAIAYLPQYFELPKFLRVEQVLAYSNKLTDSEAAKLFKLCRITHLLKRKTHELSGGERQRIALCRLLIGKPTLLLLDEPFSNLDMILKKVLKEIVEDISRKLQISCILVSHDPEDTLPWADELMVLKGGKMIQHGSAEKIYAHPVNAYVAGLFGKFNKLMPQHATKLKKTDKIFLRPEDFKIEKKKGGLSGRVMKIEFVGGYFDVRLKAGKSEFIVRTNQSLKVGEQVYFSLK